MQFVFNFSQLKLQVFANMFLRLRQLFCCASNLITCRWQIWSAPTWSHVARATWSHVADTSDHADLITCRNQIRSHVAINFLIAPTWSHIADEAEISLSRYLFTVLNYQSTHFVSLSHFNTLALYCIKVLGRTSPLYHFNALKWHANAL